jgi:uncharacterized protein YbaP (TraB family)
MKFSNYLGLLSLAAFFIIGCGASKNTINKDSAYQPWEKSLLWEVSGQGLDEPSYIFGTVHLIDKEKFFLPDQLLPALDASKEIVFEIDLQEMTDLGTQMNLLTKAYMNDGITLKDLLTEEEYKEVQDFFEKMGMPLFFFERMKPMFLSVMTSMDGDMSKIQAEMTSYEFELMDLARARRMASSGLETLDFQMSLFDSIPYESQADMLMKSIRSKNEGTEQFDAMMDMYVSQDIEAMLSSMDSEEIGDFEHLLLTKRNINWIPKIKEKAAEQPTIFAVGAGHLAGEQGVLWLLAKDGYKLKPLSTVDGNN